MIDKHNILRLLATDLSCDPSIATHIVVHDIPVMHSKDVYFKSYYHSKQYFIACKSYEVSNLYLLTVRGEILKQHGVRA